MPQLSKVSETAPGNDTFWAHATCQRGLTVVHKHTQGIVEIARLFPKLESFTIWLKSALEQKAFSPKIVLLLLKIWQSCVLHLAGRMTTAVNVVS